MIYIFQSAERILSNHFGDSITVKLYGNAPCGFYKYKYPTEVRKKSSTVGAKVFLEICILRILCYLIYSF